LNIIENVEDLNIVEVFFFAQISLNLISGLSMNTRSRDEIISVIHQLIFFQPIQCLLIAM